MTVAFQPFTSVTPLGSVNVDTHGLSVEVPLLRTVTEALKPPGHELSTLYVTVQPPGPEDGDGDADRDGEGDVDRDGDGDADADRDGEAEDDRDGPGDTLPPVGGMR